MTSNGPNAWIFIFDTLYPLTDKSFVGRVTCFVLFSRPLSSSSRSSSFLLNSPWVAKNCFNCSITADELLPLPPTIDSFKFAASWSTGVKSSGARIFSRLALVGVDVAVLVGIRGRADCGVALVLFKPGDRTPLDLVPTDELSSLRPETRTATEFLSECCSEPPGVFPSSLDVGGPGLDDVADEWLGKSRCFEMEGFCLAILKGKNSKISKM